MAIVAFMAPVTAKAEEQVKKKTMPEFKRRWWYDNEKLDARPVIWSLRNKPEDWEWSSEGVTIRHIPSDHKFWVGIGSAQLWDTGCSCHDETSTYFQVFQGSALKRAARRWDKTHVRPARVERLREIGQQFQKHFAP